MDVENFNQLLSDLNQLGFKGETLEQDLEWNRRIGEQEFSLLHTARYGDDQVSYRINILMDGQSGWDYIKEFQATLRPAIRTDVSWVGNIDLRDLEHRMGQINWNSAAVKKILEGNPTEDPALVRLKESISDILDDLERIGAWKDAHSLFIMRQLQYKYWCDTSMQSQVYMNELKAEFETWMVFPVARNTKRFTAPAAYQFMKEHVEQYKTSLFDKGFSPDNSFPLVFHMDSRPDRFYCNTVHHHPEGTVHHHVAFERKAGTEPDTFVQKGLISRLVKYIAIPEAKIEGIDTAELDQRMKTTNWNGAVIDVLQFRSGLTTTSEKSPVQEILRDLEKLEKITEGRMIADLLRAKYWLQNTTMKYFVDRELAAVFANHVNISADFHERFTARQIYNMLAGRAVFFPQERINGWFRVLCDTKNDAGVSPVSFMDSYTPYDIGRILEKMPIIEKKSTPVFTQLVLDLGQGEMPAVSMKGKTRFIYADPLNEKIGISESRAAFLDGRKLYIESLSLKRQFQARGNSAASQRKTNRRKQ